MLAIRGRLVGAAALWVLAWASTFSTSLHYFGQETSDILIIFIIRRLAIETDR